MRGFLQPLKAIGMRPLRQVVSGHRLKRLKVRSISIILEKLNVIMKSVRSV